MVTMTDLQFGLLTRLNWFRSTAELKTHSSAATQKDNF